MIPLPYVDLSENKSSDKAAVGESSSNAFHNILEEINHLILGDKSSNS